MSDAPHISIIGAGLAGALLACGLGRRGYRVDLYERRSDPRTKGFIGGRSINLALSTRGLDALERVGLADKVLAEAIPMPGRVMHSVRGRLTYQPYSKDPRQAINSVDRGKLNMVLLDAADAMDTVSLHFDHRATDIDLDTSTCTFERADGETVVAPADLLVGCDGAFSAVRGRMQRTDRFSFSQTYLEHGYKELTIPATARGEFAMEPNALHIWPRGGFMMIALPNADHTFTCTCFWPFEGPHGFDRITADAEIVHFFDKWFRDAVPLMPTLVDDFRTNPTSSLVTVRCNPWHYRDRVVLVGDSAHAIVPFYGQGANAAFEDCVVFEQCLDELGPDWERLLPEFTRRRKANGDAIADMALDNFIEMRDKVNSRAFLLRKKVEKILHRWFPRWFTPLYNLVTFSTVPYAEARSRAPRRQDRALLGIAGTVLAAAVLAAAGLITWLI